MERYLTIILDTCALLWWSLDPDELSTRAKIAIEEMEQSKNGITSAMAIWEIAIKIKNQKLDLGVPLSKYVKRVQQSDVVDIIPVEADLLVESVNLEWSHRDPVDRINDLNILAVFAGYMNSGKKRELHTISNFF